MESSPRAAGGGGQWRWALGAGCWTRRRWGALLSLLASFARQQSLPPLPFRNRASELAEEFGALQKKRPCAHGHAEVRMTPRASRCDVWSAPVAQTAAAATPRHALRWPPAPLRGSVRRRQHSRGSMVSLFCVVLAGLPRHCRVGESGRERGGSWVGGGGSGDDGAAERSQLAAALPNRARLRRREARFCTPTKAITNIIAGGEVAATRADMENRTRRRDQCRQ